MAPITTAMTVLAWAALNTSEPHASQAAATLAQLVLDAADAPEMHLCRMSGREVASLTAMEPTEAALWLREAIERGRL